MTATPEQLADLVRRLRKPSLTDKAVFAGYKEAADAIDTLLADLAAANEDAAEARADVTELLIICRGTAEDGWEFDGDELDFFNEVDDRLAAHAAAVEARP